MIGTTVSHYRITGTLGAGGMGVVYEAQDLRLPRRVALKFLPSAQASAEALARFRREAVSLSLLNHPHICTIYDIDEHDGRPFIAMERLEGHTLQTRLREGPLGLPEVVDIALQVAQGLAAAHSKHVVHRDIKPGNIFITTDGIVKLLDFGLSKQSAMSPRSGTADREPSSAWGQLVGTPSYMSPEQILQEPIDGRSDLFSLGIVFYQMLSGRLPFAGDSVADIVHNVLETEPPPVSVYRHNVPPGFDGLLEKLLPKRPADRCATSADVIAELQLLKAEVSEASPLTAIAVLPFTNRSADADDEYLSDGLTDELINSLAHLEGVRVVSRSSAFAFKGQSLDIRRIGRQLGATSVLEGTVQRVGNRLRVATELVDVGSGRSLWAETYRLDLTDVFDIQESIARNIAQALQLSLQRMPGVPLVKRYTDNVAVYNLYLRARYHLHQQTLEGFARAPVLFHQVIEKEPRFAPAYAGLADYFSLMGFFGLEPPGTVWSQAKASALEALRIDPTLGPAHTSLALALAQSEWDFTGAEREHRQAIHLSPGDARARYFYGLYLMPMGRLEEARREITRALELDPLSKNASSALAYAHYYAGDYDQALEACRQARELDPDYFEVYGCLGLTHVARGELDQAVEAFREAVRLSGDALLLGRAFLAYALGLAGQRAEAEALVDRLRQAESERYVLPGYLAVARLGLGAIDEVFEALERAFSDKDGLLLFLRVLPVFEPLRCDPRFSDLCARVGLPMHPDASPDATTA